MSEKIGYSSPKLAGSDDRGALRMLGLVHCIFGGLACVGPAIEVVSEFSELSSDRGLRAVLVGLTSVGVILVLSGSFMLARRMWIFSVVVSAVECLAFPVGTIVGAYTLVTLCRGSTRQLYQQEALERAGV